MGNIILIVLDSVGIGELPDAHEYNDVGSNTLLHIKERIPHFNLPHLDQLGLGRINPQFTSIEKKKALTSLTASVRSKSKGKDTTIGHWEMMGITLNAPMATFPNGFPVDMMKEFSVLSGHDFIGNYPASGTEIIEDLGAKHELTKKLIVYTSADSVFQIAAHEDVIPLHELYQACSVARKICDKYNISRVIARPFITKNGKYERTENRKDFSIHPPKKSVLNLLVEGGIKTVGIGKIDDIFNGEGVQEKIKVKGNKKCIESTKISMEKETNSFIFTNLVDFDMLYGHRRNPFGYYDCLKEFDDQLPSIIKRVNRDDLLMITADHGNDPTFKGTDHTREYVPLLVYSPLIQKTTDLGTIQGLGTIGKTILDFFKIKPLQNELDGQSFYSHIHQSR